MFTQNKRVSEAGDECPVPEPQPGEESFDPGEHYPPPDPNKELPTWHFVAAPVSAVVLVTGLLLNSLHYVTFFQTPYYLLYIHAHI